MEGVAAMTRQETMGGCKEMIQHIRQVDIAATTAGQAAMGGPGSWWLLQDEADGAQEVRVFGAFISPGLFEDDLCLGCLGCRGGCGRHGLPVGSSSKQG